MTSNRFFLQKPADPDSRIWVEGREHHHLHRVARVREGGRIEFFDEGGSIYTAVVESCAPDRTLVRILSREAASSPRTFVTLALALIKLPALESLIRKSTELAVSRLALITTDRSVVKASRLPPSRLERWTRIAREAAKQCKTGLIPEIRPPQTLEDFLGMDVSERKIFLSERGGAPLRDVMAEGGTCLGSPPQSVCLLVGPEGGWSSGEDHRIRKAGFQPISLGRSVLRAETAALCALSVIIQFWVA